MELALCPISLSVLTTTNEDCSNDQMDDLTHSLAPRRVHQYLLVFGRANLKSEKHQERQNFSLRASKMRGYHNWIVGLMTIGMTGW
ncbi:hypothetical protein TCAL_16331 [Tigriopus californicus]|uniref:Uncharacterized protein n=1 Tax=Tigriopus californicus TaxID=6832 RepID=A0A553N7U3_TIGCA|nr:hypothetical protein TCAL_16331 [Tigriopus californicus]